MIEFCSACVKAVILAAALAHGHPQSTPERMLCVASRETGGTFNRFAYNPAGPYVGIYQLGPSKQRAFFARGYDNLNDPAQQANFTADEMAIDPFAWTTYRSC